MDVLKYNKRVFHGVGISPSERIDVRHADIKNGLDPYWTRAMELLNTD